MTAHPSRRPVIYVCHPYAQEDPGENANLVRGICRALVAEGALPIGPHIYLPQLVDDLAQRELALSLCLQMVTFCDELRVYGDRISDGMRREIDFASDQGISVRHMNTEVRR